MMELLRLLLLLFLILLVLLFGVLPETEKPLKWSIFLNQSPETEDPYRKICQPQNICLVENFAMCVNNDPEKKKFNNIRQTPFFTSVHLFMNHSKPFSKGGIDWGDLKLGMCPILFSGSLDKVLIM